MQVGLGTDFRGHKQRHVLVEGWWGKIQSPLPHVGSFFHTQQSPDSSWGPCCSSRLWHIYSETASHASGSGLCVSSNHSPVVTCAPALAAIIQMFPRPSLWVWLICWSGSENSGKHFTHQVDGIWMEELHGAGWGKRCRHTTLPDVTVFTSGDAFWAPVFWVFMVASLLRHGWLNHWPLAPEATSSPSRPLEV